MNYRGHYGFEEEWEEGRGGEQPENYPSVDSRLQVLSSSAVMLLLVLTLWLSNLDFFFRLPLAPPALDYSSFYLFAAALLLYDAATTLLRKRAAPLAAPQMLLLSLPNLLCLGYLLAKAGGVAGGSWGWGAAEVGAMGLMYLRARELYGSLRFMSWALHYEYQAKIVDLLLTLVGILHIAVGVFSLRR